MPEFWQLFLNKIFLNKKVVVLIKRKKSKKRTLNRTSNKKTLNKRTLNKNSLSSRRISNKKRALNRKKLALYCCCIGLVLVILLSVSASHQGTSTSGGTQLEINYSGPWNGSYSNGLGFKRINGTGPETIDVSNEEVNMAALIQKEGYKSGNLTVCIVRNGNIIASESTRERNGSVLVTG